MRRSDALAPLSRDHHRALVVARDLIRAGDDGAAEASDRFVEFLAEHELGHFALEESVLVPVIPADGTGPELIRRMLEDHEFLRAAMRRLSGRARGIDVEDVREIGTRLRAHVQMEEQELFPYLERCLPEAELARVGSAIEAEHG
jgi:hemerythrin-like domain-containing protein